MPKQYLYRNLKAKAGCPTWQYGDKPKQPIKGSDGKAKRFNEVLAFSVTFKESEASWRRCLAASRNPAVRHGWDVHAYANGVVVEASEQGSVTRPNGPAIPITYDKNGCGHFIRKDTGARIEYCAYVVFASDGHSYAYGYVR